MKPLATVAAALEILLPAEDFPGAVGTHVLRIRYLGEGILRVDVTLGL